MAGFVQLHHAMIRAAARNQPDKVESMLAQGADPLFPDKEKKTAIDRALEEGSAACLRLLAPVSSHAPRPRTGDTPFLAAMRRGWLEGAQILAPFSDRQALDEAGYSALMLACARGSLPAAEWALSFCDVNYVAQNGACALVAVAAARPSRQAEQVAEMILAAMNPARKAERVSLALSTQVSAHGRFVSPPGPGANGAEFIARDVFNVLANHAEFEKMGQDDQGRPLARALLETLGDGWRNNASRIEALLRQPYFQKPARQEWVAALFSRALVARRWENADALGLGVAVDSRLFRLAPMGQLPKSALRLAQSEQAALAQAARMGAADQRADEEKSSEGARNAPAARRL